LIGPKTKRSSTLAAPTFKDENLSFSVKTEAKKTGRIVLTHKRKLEAAKRNVRRGRVGRPRGTKNPNPKEAINKNSSRVKSAAVSGI
jgi:hypothetical protein